MAAVIYGLCALVAFVCAAVLLSEYFRSGNRLLFWCGSCFVGLTFNNILLVIDKLFLPDVDLSIYRLLISQASFLVLIYGLVWEAE